MNTEVRVGSIWADNDPRCAGRTLRVDAIEDGRAVCTILTNTDEMVRDMRGRTTRISLARFTPNRTGYRCIRDTQYGVRWPTGSVFGYNSREDAWGALAADRRGVGVLVARDFEPHTDNAGEWYEVDSAHGEG